VILVRHAAHGQVGRVLTGRKPGVGLSDQGRAQANRLGAFFAEKPVAAVYSSPLQRAQETAAPIAERCGRPLRTHEGLQEIDFGTWTGRAFDSLAGDPAWDEWNARRGSARVPSGESMGEVRTRAVAAVEAIAARHPGQRVVLVSHADVIRGIVAAWLGLALDRLLRFEIGPASISVLAAGGERRLLCLNRILA
jgi:broad specificity phosphatase PhoE